MANITATEARQQFGKMLVDVQSDPVFISRNGEQVAVLLSFDALKRLLERPGRHPEIAELLQRSIERHGGVYRSLSSLG